MPPHKYGPDQSPDPDGGFDLKDAFAVLIQRTEALTRVVEQQSTYTRDQLDLQRRMSVGPAHEDLGHAAGLMAQYQPRMREDVLGQLTRYGGVPADATMGMTKMTGTGALTSLQNLQAFAAQRIGERIAGSTPPRWTRIQPSPEYKGLYNRPHEDLAAPAPEQTAPQQPEPAQVRTPAPPSPQQTARPPAGGSLAPIGQALMQGAAGVVAAGRGWLAGLTPPASGAEEELADAAQKMASAAASTAKSAKDEEAEVRQAGMLRAEAQNIAEDVTARTEKEARPRVPYPVEEVAGTGKAPAAEAPAAEAPAAEAPAAEAPPAAPGFYGGGPPPGMPGGPGGGGGPGGPPGGGPAAGGAPPAGGGGTTRPPSVFNAQQIGARVAMTGGSVGGILGGLRRLPVIGLGIDLAEGVANQYSKQREAGRVYQETEGGTNIEAQRERIHSLTYQASMFGRVPEGVAAQMFGDVTGMGFTRRATGQGEQLQNRQSALNFMYHQYTATGTDVKQSAEILATATQSATVSLKSVSDVMTSLADTSGKAGVSAKEARDNFNNLLNTAIQTGAGPGAPQLAGALASTQASYGNAFKRADFAGQLGPGMQYMLAGQYGIAPSQAQYLQRTQPQEYARMLAGSEGRFISQLPGMDPAKMADLQQRIAAAGGGAQVKAQPAIAQDIANKFLDTYQASTPGMDMNVWAQVLSQVTGKKLDPGNVMAEVVEMVAGNTQAANAQAGAPGGRSGAGTPVAAGKTGGAAAGKFGLAQGTPMHPGQGARGMENITPARSWQQVLAGGDQGAASKEYLAQEGKTGKRSPVLEALLQNVPKDAKVAVKTSAGTRVMSVADAMKYYPHEVEAGQVQFYGKEGQNLGSTGTITQGLIDPAADYKGEEAAKGPGAKAGVSLSEYQKQHKGRTGTAQGEPGGVTVDLTNEAKQLLKLLPANSDNAAAAATAPQNPYSTSPSR